MDNKQEGGKRSRSIFMFVLLFGAFVLGRMTNTRTGEVTYTVSPVNTCPTAVPQFSQPLPTGAVATQEVQVQQYLVQEGGKRPEDYGFSLESPLWVREPNGTWSQSSYSTLDDLYRIGFPPTVEGVDTLTDGTSSMTLYHLHTPGYIIELTARDGSKYPYSCDSCLALANIVINE